MTHADPDLPRPVFQQSLHEFMRQSVHGRVAYPLIVCQATIKSGPRCSPPVSGTVEQKIVDERALVDRRRSADVEVTEGYAPLRHLQTIDAIVSGAPDRACRIFHEGVDAARIFSRLRIITSEQRI